MPIAKATIEAALKTPLGERGYKIVEALTDAGYDSWWVGGAVRDMLAGKVPHDIDIATSAKPDEIKRVFSRTTGGEWSFGSVRIPLGETEFEVTTFREDDEASDGRHPESIVFGSRQDDAKRRDFTINAIYFHPISQELFDPYNGEGDVKEKLVRFIGDPATRISHDALRILRAVRLRATIDGQYHPETYAALQELGGKVEILSGERQLQELEKLLKIANPARALEDLWELQILQHMIPELAACKGIAQPADYHHEGDVWEHTLKLTRAFREDDNADVRLAALFHDCGKVVTFSLKERIRFDEHATKSADIASAVFRRLQMPKKRIEKLDWLIRHHMMMGVFAELSDERKAHWYFHPWFEELIHVFYLDIAGTEPSNFTLYNSIVNDRNHFLDAHPRPEKSLLTGAEVMELLGIQAGAKVGEALKALHDAQVKKEVTSKAEAKEFMKKLQQSMSS